MVTNLIRPSFQQGFARNASESENQGLWKGKVGHWVPSLGVQGQTLYDVSGYSKHGTLMNGTSWVVGEKGYVLSFDGTNDYVSLPPSNQVITNDNNWSISISFKMPNSTLSGSNERLVSFRRAATGSAIMLRFDDSNPNDALALGYHNGSGFTFVTIETLPNLFGDWRSVVITYDNTIYRMYIDGVEVNTSTNTFAGFGSGVASFGNELDTPADYLNGLLGSASTYNRTLNSNEIMQLYIDPFADFRLKQRFIGKAPVVGSGRIMSSLARYGGLAGYGGIAGKGGGLAG